MKALNSRFLRRFISSKFISLFGIGLRDLRSKKQSASKMGSFMSHPIKRRHTDSNLSAGIGMGGHYFSVKKPVTDFNNSFER